MRTNETGAWIVSSKWQGLVQEKLFLAQSLLRQAAEASGPVSGTDTARIGGAGLQAGLIQGAVALTLQAREALLVLTAQLNQSKAVDIASLAELADAIGGDNADVARLTKLSRVRESWWCQLDALQRWLKQPRENPKRPGDDNLIAVAVASDGPDTSPQALMRLTGEIKHYVTELCQWHGEW
jgi:hypothetical protein